MKPNEDKQILLRCGFRVRVINKNKRNRPQFPSGERP